MKKFTAVILALGIVIGGAVGTLAAGSYYTQEIDNAMQAQKQALAVQYDKKHAEIEEQIFRDTLHVATQEIDRLTKKSNDYLDAQLQSERQQRTDARAAEVHKYAEQKLQEMKKYIDELVMSNGQSRETDEPKG